MTAGYSIPKDALENPFARALIKDEPLVYDTEHTPLIDRQTQLCLLCEKWLKRDKQVLKECVDEQRLKELDEELLSLIHRELEYLHTYWLLRMVLPMERKGGFLSFFINMVMASSFAYGRSLHWTTADEAAKDVVTYLPEDGEVFPLAEWQFDYVESKDDWFPLYVDGRLKHLAKSKNTDFSTTWESTEWRSNQRRRELFGIQMEHYLRDRNVLDSLLPAHAQMIKNFCQAFFLHMTRHIYPNEDLYSQIETVFETQRPSVDQTQWGAIRNLQIPKLKPNGSPASRDLCDYIHTRKKYDPDFKQYCLTHSLEEVCKKLEALFNWGFGKDMIFGNINIDTLQKYLNRHGETIATI